MPKCNLSFCAVSKVVRGIANDVQLIVLSKVRALRLDGVDMRKLITNCQLLRRGLALVAVLLVALVVGLSYLAANGGAHHRIHHHAGEDGHQCAVTLFAGGHVLAAAPQAIIAVAVVGFCLPVGFSLPSVRSSVRYLLPFSCGPPA